jgi:DNA ligase-1
LKDITTTFLELADSVRGLKEDFIADGEVIAMRGGAILPFAELQKRLGRREGDLFMREEVPVKLVVFDLLWLNGKSLLNESLRDRRKSLEALALPKCLRLATITRAQSAEEIDAVFTAARSRDNEGLMIKEGICYTRLRGRRRGIRPWQAQQGFERLHVCRARR